MNTRVSSGHECLIIAILSASDAIVLGHVGLNCIIGQSVDHTVAKVGATKVAMSQASLSKPIHQLPEDRACLSCYLTFQPYCSREEGSRLEAICKDCRCDLDCPQQQTCKIESSSNGGKIWSHTKLESRSSSPCMTSTSSSSEKSISSP